MDGDIIVLKVPRSIKGRWVMAARRKQQRVAAWIVQAVEASLAGPPPLRWQRAEAFAELYGEPKATVNIGTSKEQKALWIERSRADGQRLGDWIVCRVEAIQTAE